MLETVAREGREVKMLRVGSDRCGPGQERVHRRDSACWILLETKPESPDWDSLDIHRGDLWMDCQGYMRSVRRV